MKIVLESVPGTYMYQY